MPKYTPGQFDVKDGYYGDGKFGGQYIPEILLPALDELEEAFETYKNDPEFLAELEYYRKNFIGRQSPLIFASNLTKQLGGAKIYLKNEGNNFSGSHKINHCIYQALLAKRMGKKTVIAETGAGQHGVAVATVAAKFNFEAKVFIGQKSLEKQYPNVFWIKQLGAQIIPVTTGNAGLTEASNAALGEWMTNPEAYFMLGSVIGPHPFPEINRAAQKIIGEEIKIQLRELENNPEILPNKIIACIGGGSNALGAFNEFLYEENVELIGVEGAGKGIEKVGDHAVRFGTPDARVGIFEGFKSYFLMDKNGQIDPTGGIAAGLDYAGIGPLHAYLHDVGRLQMVYATDKEVLSAFQLLATTEGIIMALESSHALVEAIKQAPKMSSDEIIVVNISGRGDNYLFNIAKGLEDQEFVEFCKGVGV
ncbi:MAG: tryptophan synthase subunit beta [bacterium]